MSVPAANAFSPAPVSTSAFTLSFPLPPAQIAASCSYIGKVSALRAWGRLKTIVPMPSSTP